MICLRLILSIYSFNLSDRYPTWCTGCRQRENGPLEREVVFYCCSLSISVRTRGQLMVTSVIQGPGHNFVSEDPTIFLEDANITTGERVVRPRQYLQVLLPSAPTLGAGQVGNLSMQDVQRLHQTTGEILPWAGQQQQQQPQPFSFSHSISSPSVSSPSLDIPPLEIGALKCLVFLKEFRKFAKCKSHYDTQHIRQSLYICKKCKKALGSKANLQHHQELSISTLILFVSSVSTQHKGRQTFPNT